MSMHTSKCPARHLVLPVILLCLFSWPVTAQTSERRKQPWDYTDEERLEKRFDPASIRERAEQEFAESRLPRTESLPETRNFIDGRKNPELFMPWELFQTMLMAALIDDRTGRYREDVDVKLNEFSPQRNSGRS